MPTCGTCGLFGSLADLWPAGVCSHSEGFVHVADDACVMFETDWRGVDQSDGQDPNWKGPKNECDSASVHRETPLGSADPVRTEDVRKPVFSRSPGLLSGSRLSQSHLF